MTGLTMTDCTVEANRVQARHELERAFMERSVHQVAPLSSWAKKWGRPLLDAAHDSEGDSARLELAESEATAAENERDKLIEAVESAIKSLDKIDGNRTEIDAVIGALENAL